MVTGPDGPRYSHHRSITVGAASAAQSMSAPTPPRGTVSTSDVDVTESSVCDVCTSKTWTTVPQ